MKAKRFAENQIIGVLKEAEAGAKTKELYRKHALSEATFYNWKAKYAGMTVSEAGATEGAGSREQQAEEATGGLQSGQGSADGSSGPKMLSPQAKREAVSMLTTELDFGVTRACGLLQVSTGSSRWRRPRGSSKPGGSNTTPSAHTAHSGTSPRKSAQQH